MRSPLLRGDELDDLDRSATEAGMLRAAGIDALVELTPIGLGRDPLGVAEIARRTDLQIVLATGVHREAHYPPEHWVHRTAPEVLAEVFIRDLAEGCDANDCSGPREVPTQVRAGVIKVGVGYWCISPTEHRVLEAAGQAHRHTGAAIVCHLELGTAGPDVLDALGAAGVAPDRIALAHADRNPDPGLHGELAAAGAYVCYDGAGRANYWPDSLLVQCLLQVAAAGHAERLLLGADVARRSAFRAYGGAPAWPICRSGSCRAWWPPVARRSSTVYSSTTRPASWRSSRRQPDRTTGEGSLHLQGDPAGGHTTTRRRPGSPATHRSIRQRGLPDPRDLRPSPWAV